MRKYHVCAVNVRAPLYECDALQGHIVRILVYGKVHLLGKSSDDDEDIERKIQRTAIESMPHYSVVGGRKRQEERIHQERL